MPVPYDTIDDETIKALVDAFYARVREDELLGPVFHQALHGRWDAHMPKMYDFWSSVMLTTGRYKGDPFGTHARLPRFPIELFERWLGLFGQTARELCTPDVAAAFEAKAQRIAESLKVGLYYRPAKRDPLWTGAASS